MKALICVRRLDQGGAEMLESRLAAEWCNNGQWADLCAQYGAQDFDGLKQSDYWKAKGVKNVYFFKSSQRSNWLKEMIDFYLLIRKNKYDTIISTNTGWDTIVGMIRLFIRFKHVIAYHTYINPVILASFRIKLWKFFAVRADGAYAISDYVRNNIIQHVGVDPLKIKTVYNSVPNNVIAGRSNSMEKSDLGFKKEDRLILVAGRIESRKGFDLVLKYLASLLTGEHCYLLVAGEAYSGNALEPGLKDFAHDFMHSIKVMGLEDKVYFLGYRKDLQEVMSCCDVYVHLARHEGFGLVLVEALAADIPIVASNIGGIPEVLEGTSYNSFSIDDAEGIRSSVSYWLTISTENKKKCTEASRKVLNRFTDERRASEIKQFIQSL